MFIQNSLCSQLRCFHLRIDKVMLIRSVLFNFQGAFFSHPFGRLVYYITSFRTCQVLFQNFFWNFFDFFSLSTWYMGFCLPLSQQPIYYITLFSVCQVLSELFFRFFWLTELRDLYFSAAPATAFILYTIPQRLSTHLLKNTAQ